MALKLLRAVTVVLVALRSGLAFAHVLEQPAKMGYDAVFYITLQKSLYVHWGPPNIGGFLEPLTIVATALTVFFIRKNRRAFSLSLFALLALMLAFPVVFFWLVAPANAAFLSTALPNVPPNWPDLRLSWESGHAIRFALQLAALSSLVLSLVLDAPASTSRP